MIVLLRRVLHVVLFDEAAGQRALIALLYCLGQFLVSGGVIPGTTIVIDIGDWHTLGAVCQTVALWVAGGAMLPRLPPSPPPSSDSPSSHGIPPTDTPGSGTPKEGSSMMRRLLWLSVVVLVLWGPVRGFAGSTTSTQHFNYTDQDVQNQNWNLVDTRMPWADSVGFVTYCGNLANNGTFYLASAAAPALLSVDGFARVVGDATCDGYGNATEGTADMVLSADLAVRATGMICTMESSPSAPVVFTGRNATANIAPGLTCTINSGGPISCQTWLTTPVRIPPNTPVAVKTVDTTNESAKGALCRLYYTHP